jgi:uncharacterized protein YyaL (SSP411 family)
MLYDNAQLARVYLPAWQVTGNWFFQTATKEILDYAVREMTYVGADANDQQTLPAQRLPSTAAGIAFYSTYGANSGVRGDKFFTNTASRWNPPLKSLPG